MSTTKQQELASKRWKAISWEDPMVWTIGQATLSISAWCQAGYSIAKYAGLNDSAAADHRRTRSHTHSKGKVGSVYRLDKKCGLESDYNDSSRENGGKCLSFGKELGIFQASRKEFGIARRICGTGGARIESLL
jgi:hypothetical protein